MTHRGAVESDHDEDAGGWHAHGEPAHGGRMSPSHPTDAHGTLPNSGSLPGTVNKSDVSPRPDQHKACLGHRGAGAAAMPPRQPAMSGTPSSSPSRRTHCRLTGCRQVSESASRSLLSAVEPAAVALDLVTGLGALTQPDLGRVPLDVVADLVLVDRRGVLTPAVDVAFGVVGGALLVTGHGQLHSAGLPGRSRMDRRAAACGVILTHQVLASGVACRSAMSASRRDATGCRPGTDPACGTAGPGRQRAGDDGWL